MKVFAIIISIPLVAVLVTLAILYALGGFSPRADVDAFLVPLITSDGTIEVREAVEEIVEPTFMEKVFSWREIPKIQVKKYNHGKRFEFNKRQFGDFIAFRCPKGTDIQMRGMIPPENYDKDEPYWYYGPYEEPPDETVVQRFNAKLEPSQIFHSNRFGGNASAKNAISFLQKNRPVKTGGLYLLYGKPSQKSISIRCGFTCGDGILDKDIGEECDDMNEEDDDGCSSKCKVESTCGNSIVEEGEECDDGLTCEDGTWCINPEQCDEGDCIRRDDDGCNLQCKLEKGFSCEGVYLEDRTSCETDSDSEEDND